MYVSPGIRVSRGNFSSTNLGDMNECDAPELNNIVASAELTEHYAPSS